MANNNHRGGKFFLGALVAGVAGYVAGLLTAPKSGKETRQDLADKADQLKNEAEAKLESARDELEQLLTDTKSKTRLLSAKAREEFNEAVVRAKAAKTKTVQLLKDVKAGESSDPDLEKALQQARRAGKNLRKYLKG
ncbi:YtxH domain-containing protein [Candidatus Saccharibacteria bacterium]|nr:YtxH domain-containing protein [Candidatus Saccharibacteria bacterium]